MSKSRQNFFFSWWVAENSSWQKKNELESWRANESEKKVKGKEEGREKIKQECERMHIEKKKE